jgi:protein TonB
MIRQTFAVLVATLCATELSGQTVPSTPLVDRAMAGHTNATTPVTLDEWTKRMYQVLNREIRYPTQIYGVGYSSGIVRVKFNCSDSGRPDKVALLKTSGSSSFDRAAISAVRRMASLHPLPSGFKPTQAFEAVIVFAQDPLDARLANLGPERAKRNAWYHDPELAMKAPTTKQGVDDQVTSTN